MIQLRILLRCLFVGRYRTLKTVLKSTHHPRRNFSCRPFPESEAFAFGNFCRNPPFGTDAIHKIAFFAKIFSRERRGFRSKFRV